MEIAKHFKIALNEEVSKLEILSNRWQNILENSKHVPEDIKDQIRSVVGQTKLLLNEKLKQFRDLLKNYESGRGDVNITSDDLEGFWDLVLIQVNDLKDKYNMLQVK
ncbi:disks large-associated protein 5-like [Lycorma delicatula]|uniref:disks large-associated protein 5-like n=1 Tax=Lycorma delicatula TaxID=130591 RepID=UPI003F517D00